MALVICTNIGLGGSENAQDPIELGGVSDNVRKVWRNVHDRITAIRNKWNINPALLGVQEDGGYGYPFEPFYGPPIATDYEVNIGTQGRGKRGVSTYSMIEDCHEVQALDNIHEMSTVILTYKNERNYAKKAGYINFYRNQHRLHGRSTDSTVGAIKAMIKHLRTSHNVSKVFIQGDFNDEANVNMGLGFRELTHRKLFHKANRNTRKTRIDRVWANFNDFGILDVIETAENKVDNPDKELGHKTIALYLGKRPKLPAKKSIKIIDMKELKSLTRGTVPDFSINDDFYPKTSDDINLMTQDFMNTMANLSKKATKTVKTNNNSAEKVFLNDIEIAENQILHGKKESKLLYSAMNKLKNGIDSINDTSKPTLAQLGNKLESKLDKLNDAKHDTAIQVVNEMFGPKSGYSCKNWTSLDEFKKICMNTSNSGAKDNVGFSLKITKIFLSNRTILRRYETIITRCLEMGYFPTAWKNDLIHFIYKNKGSREDAANWRPITIASSFGKHFEKTISYMISGMDDGNNDNHAYKSKRACMTAIATAQKAFLEDHLKTLGMDMTGLKVITSISLDDISGAFESVDHVVLAHCLKLIFKKETRYDIKGIILSYLNRRAKVIGDDDTDFYDLSAKPLRSIPQGSILSPLLWRLFDGIFTQLYKNTFPAIYGKNTDILVITHISYADDHMTIFSILVKATDSNVIIGRRLSRIFDMLRDLLKSATSTLGSDINPKKSESIVLKELTPFISLREKTDKDPSNAFKWLGYHLFINDKMNLEFDEKKIKETINTVNSFMRKAFSYTASVGIRWKIYKVYISPFVELFLPLVIQTTSSGPRAKTIIHDLQHRTICLALGLPWTTGRRDIEIFLGEKSVEEKAQRMATRLIDCLLFERPTFRESSMSLRSGNEAWYPTNANDKAQFIVRLFLFKESNIEKTPKIKFDAKKVKTWCINKRIEINDYATARNLRFRL